MKNNLKELRAESGLKQKEVANILNITLSSYGNYEQGTRQVPDDIKIKLAELYDVSLDFLITGEERDYSYRKQQSEIEEIYSKLTPEEQRQAKTFMLGMLSARNDEETQEFVRAKIS